MMDTGIDVLQAVNLVFFKKVRQGKILADDRSRHPPVQGIGLCGSD